MTRDEAVKVAQATWSADGGCPDCAHMVGRSLAVVFPDRDWEALIEAEEDRGLALRDEGLRRRRAARTG